MKMRLLLGVMLAAMTVTASPWHADAQSRGSVGGYSSGAAIGGSSIGGARVGSPTVGSRSYGAGIGRRPSVTNPEITSPAVRGNAPVVRPGPQVPLDNRVTTPGYGTAGSYRNSPAIVQPGTSITVDGKR